MINTGNHSQNAVAVAMHVHLSPEKFGQIVADLARNSAFVQGCVDKFKRAFNILHAKIETSSSGILLQNPEYNT